MKTVAVYHYPHSVKRHCAWPRLAGNWPPFIGELDRLQFLIAIFGYDFCCWFHRRLPFGLMPTNHRPVVLVIRSFATDCWLFQPHFLYKPYLITERRFLLRAYAVKKKKRRERGKKRGGGVEWGGKGEDVYKSQHRNASRVAVNVCTRLYHMETNKKIKVTVLGDKSFVATKLCLSPQIFVATKVRVLSCLLRQNICRDKNDTCGSSRQWYFSIPTPFLPVPLRRQLGVWQA